MSEIMKASNYATVDDAIKFAFQLCRRSMRRSLSYVVTDAVGGTIATVVKSAGVIRVKDSRNPARA